MRLVIGRRNVLRELHAGGPRTASEVAQSLGRFNVKYSVDAVADRFEELDERGLVRLGGAEAVGLRRFQAANPPGRPPRYATLSDVWGLGAGVEIGRSEIRCGMVTAGGELVSRGQAQRSKPQVEPTFREAGSTLRSLLDEITDDQREALVGIVVAVPAPVDREGRTVAQDILPWGMEPLDRRFAKTLDLENRPIMIVNDADARAIAEGRFGLARAAHSAFVLKWSGGVGGCLLRRGRILGGFRGLAGEVGHLSVSLDAVVPPASILNLPRLQPDAECSCKDSDNQHLEAYASIGAMERRLSSARGCEVGIDTIAREWTHREDARRVVEDASRLLGQALAQVMTLMDPQVVVITGRAAACGALVADPIRQILAGHRPRHPHPPEVVVDGPPLTARKGRESEWLGVRGAGRLAVELNTSADDPPVELD
ncbi:MAG: hypothetical protein QOJ29_1790 [Thermoleophilaceae bacterium]|nr:hypothetical protein [Thermoleophilaceae bacterium]